MSIITQCKINLGKQGVTDNFISTLNNAFKTHKNIKICITKSGGHDKEKIRKYSEEILEKLGKNYSARIVGFTIAVKRLRNQSR